MGRFLSHGTLPTIELALQNAAATARRVRADLREKVTARVKTASVRSRLREGSLFSTSLFHENTVKKAEDYCKMVPPVIDFCAAQASQQHRPVISKTFHTSKLYQPNSNR